jgi:hypothetical protein
MAPVVIAAQPVDAADILATRLKAACAGEARGGITDRNRDAHHIFSTSGNSCSEHAREAHMTGTSMLACACGFVDCETKRRRSRLRHGFHERYRLDARFLLASRPRAI